MIENQFYCYSARCARANSSIQAVIFDLDGVLMDSEWLAFEAWRELAEQYGGILDASTFSELTGTTAEQTAEIVMRRTGVTFDIQESVTWTQHRVAERLKSEIQALPGAKEMVLALAARDLPLAIASNSSTSFIHDSLRGLRLSAYFTVMIGIDQVEYGKPAPDVYLRAAEQVGVRPESCLVFEDSHVGAQAGAAAGMRVVAVPDDANQKDGFDCAWRIYPSLVKAREDLDEILA